MNLLIKISFKRRTCHGFGGGKLFYAISNSPLKLKLTAYGVGGRVNKTG
jgi:hypothetical protein